MFSYIFFYAFPTCNKSASDNFENILANREIAQYARMFSKVICCRDIIKCLYRGKGVKVYVDRSVFVTSADKNHSIQYAMCQNFLLP